MKLSLSSLAVSLLLLFFSCKHDSNPAPVPVPSTPSAIINTSAPQQLIDGFGGSTAWSSQLSDAEFDALFNNDTTTHIGLSIVRLRIDPGNAWADEKANAIKAKARGALVFASPWSPPASMKTNTNVIGGELMPSQYSAYADWLKSFCTELGNVDAISLQNEPNISVDYESCTWSASQLLIFVKSNSAAIGKPIVMPEAYNFSFALSDATLNDATAAAAVTYVGGHLYGTTSIVKYTNALNKGKRTWMTEHYYDANDLTTCLKVAKEIHDCMTLANNSAYVWWTLKAFGCYIIQNGAINKKGYMIGQFSKFIRPGYSRVDATPIPNANIYISAYTKGSKVVIVAINMGGSSFDQPFAIQNMSVASVTPYMTSGAVNMSKGTAVTVASDGTFTATLPAQSVTTFVSN